ncbi:MAG: hypothetical protein OXQ93_17195 [Gemmatimonadota bacterium]|nr:hypothetical protein [Gemmatimonadota bacterium]
MNLSAYFTDPDGDSLTFYAVSGQPHSVVVEVTGSMLELAARLQGVATVTVTATDPEGLTASSTVEVSVPNQPPVATKAIPPITSFFFDGPNAVDMFMSEHFTDPDGDPLGFDAWSSNDSVATVVDGRTPPDWIQVFGHVRGNAEVEVTAHDPSGLTVRQSFSVTVSEHPDRAALEALYHAAPPDWGEDRGNWLSDLPLRMWQGVRIHEDDPTGSTRRVVSLEVSGLAGHLSPEIGNLAHLTKLALWGHLTGSIPAELGNLANLTELTLLGVPIHLSGPIPMELSNLQDLERLYIGVPGCWAEYLAEHCAPYHRDLCAVDSMLEWLAQFPGMDQVRRCDVGEAHLMQGVQTREGAVPLVAGEPALLRVFDRAPPMVARFYLAGAQVHTAEVHQLAFHGDPDVLPDALGAATVPGPVVLPGLEMVVEGEGWRIPAEGRQTVDVREMPPLDLTLMWSERPDDPDREAHVAAIADSMADAPHSYWRLRPLAGLLPASDMDVAVHGPVNCAGTSPISCVRAVRALEGGTGYWLGLTTGFGDCAGVLAAGCAVQGGRVAVAMVSHYGLELGVGIIAHELGHNMGLLHPPGGWGSVDPNYPHPDGIIGSWGRVPDDILWQECPAGRYGCGSSTHRLVTPAGFLDPLRTWDIMDRTISRAWISGYHFTKALEARLTTEGQARAARGPVRSLLLWGGTDLIGAPYLEPVFVADAPPSLPNARGPWTLEGRDADGTVLFSLPFDMPRIADAGEDAGGFAYTLPVRPGWEVLASVTLSGPGGTTILDANTDQPMSIRRDERGQVRAILRGDPVQADGSPDGGVRLFSRGIPDHLAWRQ